MGFWLIALFLTLAATLAVLLPLTRKRAPGSAAGPYDIEVYRDQMREVEADAARGLIDPQSAEEARAEIGRRLLRAGQEAEQAPAAGQGERWTVLAAVLSVPLVAWGLYGLTGSPDLPSEPLASRAAQRPVESSVGDLIARAEAHLKQNPDDGRGWDVLAPIYLRLGRFEDAVNAYRAAIRLQGESAERALGLGQALTAAAGGTATEEAQEQLDSAAAQINAMVAGLDARLAQNPDDLDGWKRLVRSYLVLNRRDDAASALKRGSEALAPEKRNDLIAFARRLGLELTEAKP
ncbi:c-type cytochrome biogenesis protein CcmI [Brucella sp. IR073]|uniref:c-type cytochrome biogenesis protein CcmI n=1 Tax=unclassified Brucella TaxID=2632610 RepID=UPI003B983705